MPLNTYPRDASTLFAFVGKMVEVIRSHDHKPFWLSHAFEELAEGYDEERLELDRALEDYMDMMVHYRARGERAVHSNIPMTEEEIRRMNHRLKVLQIRVVEECIDLANRLYFMVDKLELREVENGASRRAHTGGSQGANPEDGTVTGGTAGARGTPARTGEASP